MSGPGLQVGVSGIGLLGPGLDGWAQGAALLRDPAAWQSRPTAVPAPARLPANERRRAGTVIKASIAVADQAVAMAGADPATLATVFVSASGDPLNCHQLCEALAAAERAVSPTRFTNSVHNTPAGYWHIATHSMAPSTSLAAWDASFGAGLLEAAVMVRVQRRAVLLVACDMPYPEPLHAKRPLPDTFAVALLLVPGAARLRIAPADGGEPTPMADPGLDALRRAVPAARALPLLHALAGAGAARATVEAADGLLLDVEVAAA
jgi:hypothetical protein